MAGCGAELRDTALPPADTGRNPWHFADLPAPQLVRPPVGTIELREVGRFGSEEGGDWLSNIGSLAVSDRVLVVSTPRTCEFVVFSRDRRTALSRFGRCGEGPDEFDAPAAIALHGDTLIATDRRGTRIRWLSLTGRTIREHRIDPPLAPSAERWTFVQPLGDSALVLAAALDAHDRRGGRIKPRDSAGHYLRVWIPGHDTAQVTLFRDGPGVVAENYGYERTTDLCVGRFSSGTLHLTAWNDWTDQTVSLDLPMLATGRVRAIQNVSMGLAERTPQLDDQKPSRTAPNGLINVACGTPYAVSNHRWWKPGSNHQGPPTDGRLTVYDHRGPVAMLNSDQRTPVLMTRLWGAHGDSFFFGSSVDFEYPMIVEMKLRRIP